MSVIIPDYRVAKFLPKCIESIQSQDHQNIEIILVDDGSDDVSGKICNEYADSDCRIVVIHKPNLALENEADITLMTAMFGNFNEEQSNDHSIEVYDTEIDTEAMLCYRFS